MSERERDTRLVLAAASSMLVVMAAIKTRKKRRKKSAWMKRLLREREKGQFAQLVTDLQLHDENDYRRYMRIDVEQFKVRKIYFIIISILPKHQVYK